MLTFLFVFLFLLWLILLPSMALLTNKRALHALMAPYIFLPVGAVLWFLLVVTI